MADPIELQPCAWAALGVTNNTSASPMQTNSAFILN